MVITGTRGFAGAVVGLGLLLGAAGLAYRHTVDLTTTRWWIAHTHDVIDDVNATVSTLKDAEIAVRSYLVTGDDDLARRRELARPALMPQLARLHRLVADSVAQQGNLHALDAAIRAKLAYADDVVEQRRTRGLGAAELQARLAEGARRLDEIEGLAAQVQHEERRLLAEREAAARASTRRTLAGLMGGTIVGVALLAAILARLSQGVVQRREAEARLRLSERRLTLALEASQMGLWDLDLVTDESHRTLRHDQIFGYDTLQPSWGREVFQPHLHPGDREVERRAFANALASGTFQMECRIIRHGDAAIRWISCQGKVFRDERGEPIRMMGSVMDITERKEFEERLRERTLQLEAANEALGSFTYSVSHDLRAPLRAINGYAHILVEDHADALDAESRRVLDVIVTNARQMGRLIDDLLSFSRLGRSDLEPATTDLAALTRAVIDEVRRLEPDRRVRVDLGALPAAVVDASMMRQVLTNLIANAWKFTRGRPEATIEIGSVAGEHETVFFVRDNGAGFDMQYVGKLFRVFERLHDAEEFEGTGVGLAIVHRVVQRHGGRVWAESAVDGGATFYFTLPSKGAQHGAHGRGDPPGRGQSGGHRVGREGAEEA